MICNNDHIQDLSKYMDNWVWMICNMWISECIIFNYAWHYSSGLFF